MSKCKQCGGNIRWFKGLDGSRWIPLEHASDGPYTIDAHGKLRLASAPGLNGRGIYGRHACGQ